VANDVERKFRFKPIAAVVRTGVQVESGHYSALVRGVDQDDDPWWLCSDERRKSRAFFSLTDVYFVVFERCQ